MLVVRSAFCYVTVVFPLPACYKTSQTDSIYEAYIVKEFFLLHSCNIKFKIKLDLRKSHED